MEKKIILEMKHITKRFQGVMALDDVTFHAYKGEILALCGENGAGKSTLMKILSGSYPETSYEGEIYINGEACHFMDPAQSENMGIGMIYQEISMHLDMTVAENLFIGRWPMKGRQVDWKKMNAKAKEYLDLVGLDAEGGFFRGGEVPAGEPAGNLPVGKALFPQFPLQVHRADASQHPP